MLCRQSYFLASAVFLFEYQEAQPAQDWRHRATKALLKSYSWSVKGSKCQLVRFLAMTYDDNCAEMAWYHYLSWQEFALAQQVVMAKDLDSGHFLLLAGENRTTCWGNRNIPNGFMFLEIIVRSTYQYIDCRHNWPELGWHLLLLDLPDLPGPFGKKEGSAKSHFTALKADRLSKVRQWYAKGRIYMDLQTSGLW